MHIINDENGNPCPHGHHEHDHDHNPHGSQGHCGACGEGHHHDHAPLPEGASEQDKMVALVDYMWKHNEHHAAELDQVAGKLREQGQLAAAEQIKKAVDEFQKGNMYLSLALSMLREGK